MNCVDIKFRFIYKTTNLINGKIYIGQHTTKNINDRYFGSGNNIKLAIRKYGKENFKREILEYCETQDELNIKELYFIKNFNSLDNKVGYNIIDTINQVFHGEDNPMYGKIGKLNPFYGKGHFGEDNGFFNKKHSESTRNIMSTNHVDVTKENNPFWGKQHSKQTKDIISKKVSGENNPNFGKIPWNKGVPISKETRKKMIDNYNNRQILICPYCGKESKHIQNMNRFHFNNCKQKQE